MSMRISDKILAPSRGETDAVLDYAIDHDAARYGDVQEYEETVYALCAPDDMPDASVVIAQSAHETDAWKSLWWDTRLNPAGMGITGDPRENAASPTFETGAEAAAAHVSHLLLYAMGPADAGSLWFQRTGQSITDADPRYDAYVEAYGNTAQADTIAELAGTWATDALYAEKIVARGNAVFPGIADQQKGGSVPTFTTTIPGLPGGALVTSYPIRFNMIPARNTRQRPGIKAKLPRRSVQHGTGNPANASAYAEAQYFVNGAEGRQASIHYCTDDREAVVVVPLSEVTWQAADGAGPGNMNGFSCEMMEADAIWNDPARRNNLITVSADLMGRTAARLGVTVPEQHWDFNYGLPPSSRHDCPYKLRHTTINGRPAWDLYVMRWQASREDELRRMGGGKPVYAKAKRPPLKQGKPFPHVDGGGHVWLVLTPARWRALATTERRQYAEPDAPEVGPPVDAGDRITAIYSVVNDGSVWFVSRQGSRMRAEAFVPVVE